MAAKVHFFPLGNADTLRIDLADGRKLLVDTRTPEIATTRTIFGASFRRNFAATCGKHAVATTTLSASLISTTTTARVSATSSGWNTPRRTRTTTE